MLIKRNFFLDAVAGIFQLGQGGGFIEWDQDQFLMKNDQKQIAPVCVAEATDPSHATSLGQVEQLIKNVGGGVTPPTGGQSGQVMNSWFFIEKDRAVNGMKEIPENALITNVRTFVRQAFDHELTYTINMQGTVLVDFSMLDLSQAQVVNEIPVYKKLKAAATPTVTGKTDSTTGLLTVMIEYVLS